MSNEWHHMFEDIGKEQGLTPSDVLASFMEKGMIVWQTDKILKDKIESRPAGEKHNAGDIADFLDDLIRAQMTPGQRYVKEVDINYYNSYAEKYGHIRGMSLLKDAYYKTYRLPVQVKKWLVDMSEDIDTTPGCLVQGLVMTGMALQYNLSEFAKDKDSLPRTMQSFCKKMSMMRYEKFEYKGKGRVISRMASYEKKTIEEEEMIDGYEKLLRVKK